jgi:hypothetical protein
MGDTLLPIFIILMYLLCFMLNMGLSTAYVGRRYPFVHNGEGAREQRPKSAAAVILVSFFGPFSLPAILFLNFSYGEGNYGFTLDFSDETSHKWKIRRLEMEHERAREHNRRAGGMHELYQRHRYASIALADIHGGSRRHIPSRVKNRADGECITIWDWHKSRKKNDD